MTDYTLTIAETSFDITVEGDTQTIVKQIIGGTHQHALSDLRQSGATSGQVPTWNGTIWAPATPSAGAAGSSGQLQVNSGGALAGATNVEIENNLLRLDAVTSPATPATGGVALFGRADAGRTVPAFEAEDGLTRELQAAWHRSWPTFVRPQAGAGSVFTIGLAAPTATGTATAVGFSAANALGYVPRVAYAVTVAATTAVAGVRTQSLGLTVGGGSAGIGGFAFVSMATPSSGVSTATHRYFQGLINQATGAPTDVEPSNQLNCIGIGYDAADANLQMMHNNGSGACTKIDLGASFPKPAVDNTNLYEVSLFSPKGTTQRVDYLVRDRISGALVSGTITTNLPATSLFLRAGIWISVGGTSSVIGCTMSMIACDPLL